MQRKIKNIFVQGGISPAFIAESIAHHQPKTNIGGHSIFLGQVRADVLDGNTVQSINYTAYEEMALEKMVEKQIFPSTVPPIKIKVKKVAEKSFFQKLWQ